VRGTTYDAALREHLITPLGLTHAATNAYEAILFRAAVGHVETEPGAGQQPAPVWAMARSNAPAGSMLAMRPRDLLAFARMHLEDGKAADGTQVLAPGTSARMQEQQVTLPPIGMMGTSWGLGFERFDDASTAVVGHDGNTIGQAAFCRMVPEYGLAVVLLSNGGDAFSLYRDVVGHVLEELGSVQTKALPTPPSHPEPVDASRYVGTYSAEVYDLHVSQDDDGKVWIETVPKGFLAELGETPEKVELVAYDEDMLIPLQPDRGMHMPHAFLGDDGDGRSQYLFLGRIVRRAGA
jgi:CubicO group peptidase (beta-lactamase class C family)